MTAPASMLDVIACPWPQILVEELPAAERAALAWAPQALRLDVLSPLEDCEDPTPLQPVLDALCRPYLRWSMRLAEPISRVLANSEARLSIEQAIPSRLLSLRDVVASRLRQDDPTAADDLVEALAVGTSVFSAIPGELRAVDWRATQAEMARVTDEDPTLLLREVGDGGRVALHYCILMVCAIEVLQRDAPLPRRVPAWCHLACDAGWWLRIDASRGGVHLPPVQIPGWSALEWRERRASRVLGGFSNGELIEFGRAAAHGGSTRA